MMGYLNTLSRNGKKQSYQQRRRFILGKGHGNYLSIITKGLVGKKAALRKPLLKYTAYCTFFTIIFVYIFLHMICFVFALVRYTNLFSSLSFFFNLFLYICKYSIPIQTLKIIDL